MSRILTVTFSALLFAAPALADTVPQGATVLQNQPTGAGKPNAVSCYEAVPIGSRIRNLHCARNSDWVRMNVRTELGSDVVPPDINAVPAGAAPTR
jgi:hypothetical protein